jgi:phosphate transport system ATP-binding protein
MTQLGQSAVVGVQGDNQMGDELSASEFGKGSGAFPAIRRLDIRDMELGMSRDDTVASQLRPDIATAVAPVAAFDVTGLNMFYGSAQALKNVNIQIYDRRITAIIGPSGCGKSTFLRCFNRMNDLIAGARVEGKILFRGQDLYAPNVDPVAVRKTVGMVFQKPNPFPKSIYENVAYGAKINGIPGKMNDIVERTLRQAELWDEVKDKLKQSGLALSGGQQQRLCIARTLAAQPDVICSKPRAFLITLQ